MIASADVTEGLAATLLLRPISGTFALKGIARCPPIVEVTVPPAAIEHEPGRRYPFPVLRRDPGTLADERSGTASQ